MKLFYYALFLWIKKEKKKKKGEYRNVNVLFSCLVFSVKIFSNKCFINQMS